MQAYLLRRLCMVPLVLLGISLLTFGLLSLAPGDPAEILLRTRAPGSEPPREAVLALRRELRLDDPLPLRYVHWLGGVVQGDLGVSYHSRRAITVELQERLPATLLLTGASLALAVAIGLPLGVLAAARFGTGLDAFGRLLGLLGSTIPSYVLALGLILLFAVHLRWLPAIGYGEPRHLVLPAIALALGSAAQILRLTRASLLEVLGQDYIQTARAKGLRERQVIVRHALKNASLPVITAVGVSLGHLLGGAVVVETIFGWPGVGKYAVDAIFRRDYPVIQGFVLYVAVIFVALNVAVDVAYRWLDPRLHFGHRVA